jgi:uncharacterized protein
MNKIIFLSLFFASTLFAAQPVPPSGGRITDMANILGKADMSALDSKIESLETATGAQIEVLVVPALGGESIAQYASRVEQSWNPEENAVDKSILFLVAVGEKKAYLVVGAGLQDALPVTKTASILSSAVFPDLKQGMVVQGVSSGIDAISKQIEEDRVDDLTPPLHTLLGKPVSFEEILHYLMLIGVIAVLLSALMILAKRKDIAEYLKNRRKRYPFK